MSKNSGVLNNLVSVQSSLFLLVLAFAVSIMAIGSLGFIWFLDLISNGEIVSLQAYWWFPLVLVCLGVIAVLGGIKFLTKCRLSWTTLELIFNVNLFFVILGFCYGFFWV